MRPNLFIEYQIADALTEVNSTLSINDENLIAGATRCRLRVVGNWTAVCTEVLVRHPHDGNLWYPLRTGVSERLIRAMSCLISDGEQRPFVADANGDLVMDLGDLKENS